MVDRKEGHVVAICSIAGLLTIPCAVTYCTTKFGVNGFMEALKDELELLEQDFIKTTIVYPSFVNTRKDLEERLNATGNVPRSEPKVVAKIIVDGVLRNQRKIIIPSYAKHLLTLKQVSSSNSINRRDLISFYFCSFLPDRIIKYIKTKSMDISSYKQYRLDRLPNV